MSMSTFLFAADALRLEDGVGFSVQPPAGAAPAPRPDVAAKNAENMQKMMGLMGGVQKGRRR